MDPYNFRRNSVSYRDQSRRNSPDLQQTEVGSEDSRLDRKTRQLLQEWQKIEKKAEELRLAFSLFALLSHFFHLFLISSFTHSHWHSLPRYLSHSHSTPNSPSQSLSSVCLGHFLSLFLSLIPFSLSLSLFSSNCISNASVLSLNLSRAFSVSLLSFFPFYSIYSVSKPTCNHLAFDFLLKLPTQ